MTRVQNKKKKKSKFTGVKNMSLLGQCVIGNLPQPHVRFVDEYFGIGYFGGARDIHRFVFVQFHPIFG